MKNQILASALALITLVSCQPEGRIFYENKELSPDLEWKKEDQREFKVEISNTDKAYDLSLTFRYANGFQFNKANVRVTEIDPDGIASVYPYELKVRDENGDYIGEPGLDIWDSEHLVEKGKIYDKQGTYTYIIEHTMPQDPLFYAMEIGLIIDEAK
tara:strand:+ start:75335 stop:75805 length:471 start_codon:yes stop_codon:yes gene_type:complete